MALLNRFLLSIIVASIIIALATFKANAQTCGCAANLCCSKYGYCGTTYDYCGPGCREGPCLGSGSGSGSGSGREVADIVTPAFFNGIISKASSGCAGKSFYTRSSFLTALSAYKSFGKRSTAEASKREIAAFFAHITHETGHMCYIEEINGASKNYCNRSGTSSRYPCAAGKKYHGRGPLQLTWNYNYGAAGNAVGFDGLHNPETVANNNVVSFKTALWFWMTNVRPVLANGFGATIRAINSIECNGGSSASLQARVGYYQDYCRQLGISPGASLYC